MKGEDKVLNPISAQRKETAVSLVQFRITRFGPNITTLAHQKSSAHKKFRAENEPTRIDDGRVTS
jgi:hypothetical protein